ncbi:MAG: PH domain-containing protein [Prevotellaceae bacterium]|jgi:uncharacterized membrane protein YdbT with pleckstrin-like domain|nr:PH domain-containing protein [Prevotellaceae bacterium]
MSSEINTEEQAIWTGSPSQWLNFMTYAYCIVITTLIVIVLIYIQPTVPTVLRWLFFIFLLYPVGRALFAWYEVRSIRYKITGLRFLHREGIFNRVTTETKLSEIREVLLIEPWYKRIVGLGDIRLNLKGFSESYVVISGIRRADEIKELINNAVKQHQTEKTTD